ncbi:MAG: tRNA dimethylallyltransferase [Phycisphaerales bacterium]|nr:tRNA (adenosine(37)-N6)-dimethylallyltransferase MiaA [Phycisphaerales bacterium]GIK18780.1 MAG: tRNA dimethylallyltransferase [Planctomycetota bacterium]
MPSCFPVIVGPTASGKSALAVEVALALEGRGMARGEVVSADAFQVYRCMDVGTAKPTPAERRGVVHHLIDIVEPDDPEPFTLHRWLALANSRIDELRSRGITPIVVGGTHLYIKALLDGLFEGPGEDAALRAELRAMDPAARRRELERVDPAAAARIHPNDERRSIRALEVFRLTGRPITEHQSQWDRAPRPDALLVGVEWPTEALNRRINARVKAMMQRGLLDEVRALAPRLGPQAREALGYKQLLAHLEGRATLDEAVEAIKIETRRFAKNQRTWLRRLREIPGSIRLTADEAVPPLHAQTIVDTLLAL